MKKFTGEWSGQELREIIRMQNDRVVDYCSSCGGSGKKRTGLFGSDNLDFSKCETCNGTGRKRKIRGNETEKLLQTWRIELSR